MTKRWWLWAFLVSVALSFVLYGNTFKGEFVWDDVFFTKRDDLAQISHIPKLFLEPVLPQSPTSGLYRPFTMATFSLNLAIGGKHPFGFHLVSIILNALAAFLLLRVVYKLFNNKPLAVFTALFFMFLPIHTEAVALMKARDELLGTVFALWSWLLFLRATTSGPIKKKWLAWSAVVFLAGLFSKEFVIMAPPLFYLVYWAQRGIRPVKEKAKELGWGIIFFGVCLAVFLIFRHLAIPEMSFGHDNIGPLSNVLIMPERWVAFLTAFKIAFIYISKIVIPIGLTASYHFKAVTLVGNLAASPEAMKGVVLLAILFFVVFWKRTAKTPVGVGALSFLFFYFPVSQFVFIGGDIVGERWMYLASIGIAMILGWVFTLLFRWKKYIGIVLFSALLAWYATILIPRNLVWRNEFSLFSSMVHDSPKSVRGYSSLAQYYFEHGDYKTSAEFVNKGFAITDQEPNLFVIAASLAYIQGHYSEAESDIRKALSLPTFSTVAVLNFPRIMFAQGKYKETLLWFDQYVSMLNPAVLGSDDKMIYASTLSKLGQCAKSNTYLFDQLASDIAKPETAKLIAYNYYCLGNTKTALYYYPKSDALSDQEKIDNLKKFKNK